MTGPITILAFGYSCLTACPTKCAQECRITSTPSLSLGVIICTRASEVILSDASASTPFTLPATVAFAKPAPIDAAISATVTGCSNWRTEPSGKVILIIKVLQNRPRPFRRPE